MLQSGDCDSRHIMPAVTHGRVNARVLHYIISMNYSGHPALVWMKTAHIGSHRCTATPRPLSSCALAMGKMAFTHARLHLAGFTQEPTPAHVSPLKKAPAALLNGSMSSGKSSWLAQT